VVAPRKYPDELRERAIRLTVEARKDPASRAGACGRIGGQLGINAETLRTWVVAVEAGADGGRRVPVSAEAARVGELEKENRELRRANAILRSASVFFAAELDRPQR
jgi:transposase